MENALKEISLEGKKVFKLPKGAVIVSKTENISVKEIENGFILRKSYDIKYQIGDDNNYEYFNKEWYSKENPLKITMPKEEKSLADKLD
ncbi:hypothetical protein BOX09_gp28 [Flavobacterium phage Fpv1]|uniref:Uncharacterized protein n=2 Tax=Fipvunavirus Fpv1 TaxID=2560475 RepID=A0A1B0WKN4_9CAUD|nr:hypothetical protein BOW81_gp28 [Flavobacterium phage Fpv20]YP_009322030.1 hypothetical protein BOX09_gp28 [Flavobacterium phage Fpv1]YP_009323619.1 hypothetical protein BOW82_gp28 [Flavobacterium phage Fpv2]ALN97274.1 hypothetical protein [Flavobacterium phage FpV21]QCW20315.1 hypothetical protein [Flavobacterium phage FPSV-F12]QCW20686.1 hypothetical protein [Flavobacterium phage FPSV-S29]ANB40270.1 hypothetical protein [Flavobacterium phage Fpv1]ANB40350.1 hypothetical protein [Flavoba